MGTLPLVLAQNSFCFKHSLPAGWTDKSSHSPGFDTLFLFTPAQKTAQITVQSFDYDQPELYLKSSAEQFSGEGTIQQKLLGKHNAYAIEGPSDWHYLFLCKNSDQEDCIVTITINKVNAWEQAERKALITMLNSLQ